MDNKVLDEAYEYFVRYETTENKLLNDAIFSNMRISKENNGFYNEELPRILMFGSFKAGKSTLVNALTGRKLAAVGPFEKTSWIARYWPSDVEFCHIEKKDGSTEEISIEDFVKNTQMDAYDAEYLSSIYRVDIGYKTDSVNVGLIDSPGFGAKEENELRALDSLQDADLVFYLIDVNKLGKMREQAIVQKIRETNVPMVCIATKYDDDIAEDVEYERVKKMVSKHTGFDEKDIYPVSVKNYMEGEEDHYFDSVIKLCDEIRINKKELRKASQQANQFKLSNHMLSCFQKLRGEINNVTSVKNEFQKQFFYYQKIVNFEIKTFIKDYVRKTLYADYKENIVRVMELYIDKEDAERNMILSSILPRDYLNDYMEKLAKVVSEKQAELWNDKMQDVALLYGADFQSFQDYQGFQNIQFHNIEAINSFANNEKALKDSGVKWSLGVAGFASFYEAVLGANAASVLLTGAAVTTGLPLAAAGLIITGYLLKKRRNSGEGRSVIRDAVEKEIMNFGNIVSDFCIGKIEVRDAEVCAEYVHKLDCDICTYFPSEEYNVEIEKCDQITEGLKKYVDSIEFSNSWVGDDELLKQNRVLTEEKEKLLSELLSMKDAYKSDLQDKNEKINELDVENGSLNKQIQENKNDIDNLTGDIKSKENEIDALKNKKAELEKDRENNQEKIAQLSSDIGEKEKELEDKKNEINRINGECEKLKKTKEDNCKKIDKLKNDISELREKHKTEMAKKQKKLDEKTSEISRLKEEIKKLTKQKPGDNSNKEKLEKEIYEKLDQFIHLGENKLKMKDSIEGELAGGFENLIFFKEEDLDEFLNDLREILKTGIEQQDEGFEIISLVNDKYIISRSEKYKAYCRLNDNLLTVKYVDVWNKDADKYRRYKKQLTNAPVLVDDELRYSIFDQIMRAKKQIVIVVPWITNGGWYSKKIYGRSFESEIRSAINRSKNLKVYIVTGNSDSSSSESKHDKKINNGRDKDQDKETREMIEVIRKKYTNKEKQLIIYDDCIIHDKMLIIDDSFRMVGSYNMLSNIGVYMAEEKRQSELLEVNENPKNVKESLEQAANRAGVTSDYFSLEV